MFFLKEYFGALGVLGEIFILAFLVLMFVHAGLDDSPAERKRFIRDLNRDRWRARYSTLLRDLLDWVDRRMAAREIRVQELESEEEQAAAGVRNRDAFSLGLLDLCLALAIAYPLLSMFLSWGWSGQDGRIGTLTVLPAEADPWTRGATIGGLALTLFFLRMAFVDSTRQRLTSLWIDGGEADRPTTLLLFLGVLPILNAFADFGSTGATRHFLRRALETGSVVWTVADILAGLAIFLALGGAIVAVVAAVQGIGGPVLIDLGVLFGGAEVEGSLRHPGSIYTWLYVMMLSTLLPTVVHLALFLLSFATTAPRFMRLGIAGPLLQGRRGDKGAGNWGLICLCAALSGALTLAIALVWGLWEGATRVLPHLEDWLIEVFACWAALLGAM